MAAYTKMISKSDIDKKNVFIHPDSKISPGIHFARNITVYQKVFIGKNVYISDNSIIGQPPKSIKSVRTLLKSPGRTVIGPNVIIGSNVIIYAGCNIKSGAMIADQASIRENCSIGRNTIIGRASTVENNTKIGDLCKIETGAHITGNAIIKKNVFIGPHVTMTNDKYMGKIKNIQLIGPIIESGAKIGANVTILPAVKIGKLAIIGAGSVVTRDVGKGITVIGVPAKPILNND